ncbi:small subunit ribosomal protein S3Ae [Nematocida minor]|uniref:small subunit ribosomal protein S3Ae n=1 Tax=Nematocida minor TaxID=1912983 RepID=UPI002220308B|nr:small subunit ribosomal protein S3Ae [Nematocida minor]KAI5192676.1 small subunit ribosomal protein S3Ae [Nematocida minor]
MASKGKANVSSVGSKVKGKKIRAKKTTDVMSKKEFYNLTLPSSLGTKQAGVTIIDKSQGNYFAPNALKGRTFEVNQGDLVAGSNTQAFRKFKFVVDGVKGKDAISSFHTMELISDKIKSIPKKWHTLVEACLRVETTDGYVLRVFTIANTKRKPKSTKKNCYANLSQVKAIRQIIFKIIEEEISNCNIHDVMKKLMNETIGSRIEQEGVKIYPLQNCHVKKVKVIKRPKVDESEFESKQKGKKVELLYEQEATA